MQQVQEKLKGDQHKLDHDKDGDIGAADFKHMRKKKKSDKDDVEMNPKKGNDQATSDVGEAASKQVDEISRSMTPMKNKFGGTVIPKKFDAYKKHMKTHKLDEPTVRMIHQNPDEAESKRMMKNPKYAKAVDMYKAAHKNESVEEATLDEISPELQKSYKTKAMKQYKQSARQKEVGGIGGTTKQATADKHMNRFMKRHKGIGSTIKRDGGSPKTNRDPAGNSMTAKPAPYKNESVDEAKKYLDQKEIKKALASIKPPKKKPTLPKAPWDK